MSEIKLQDYIQYYIGCRCVNSWFPEGHDMYNANWILEAYCSKDIKPYKLDNENTFTWTDSIKPILHKVDSITWGEWEMIRKQLSLDLAVFADKMPYKDKSYWVLVIENRITTNTLRFNDGIVLMKYGYDVFGLIDAGLAVDYKTLK